MSSFNAVPLWHQPAARRFDWHQREKPKGLTLVSGLVLSREVSLRE